MKGSKNTLIQQANQPPMPSYIEIGGKFYKVPADIDEINTEDLDEITEIKICFNHRFRVPLLWTYSFPGTEYWCPYCGHTCGMFGAGDNVPVTKELLDRRDKYREFSAAYLMAQVATYCISMIINGERVKREDIPEEKLVEFEELREHWRYEVKL